MIRSVGYISNNSATGATGVMTNGDTIFTIASGPIAILQLQSVCITANGVALTTMQYSSSPTVGSATTFSGASASLASATAGTTVTLNQTALTTAPDIVTAAAGGLPLGANVSNMMVLQAGTITLVIGTGPTTGTWKHYIAYVPLAPGATVV